MATGDRAYQGPAERGRERENDRERGRVCLGWRVVGGVAGREQWRIISLCMFQNLKVDGLRDV